MCYAKAYSVVIDPWVGANRHLVISFTWNHSDCAINLGGSVSVHLKRITLLSERFPTVKHYPFTLPIFQDSPSVTLDTPVTCFVGENGSGKSTLLEAVARACGIHIWQAEDAARYQASPVEGLLYKYMRVEWVDGPVSGSFFGSDLFRDFMKSHARMAPVR